MAYVSQRCRTRLSISLRCRYRGPPPPRWWLSKHFLWTQRGRVWLCEMAARVSPICCFCGRPTTVGFQNSEIFSEHACGPKRRPSKVHCRRGAQQAKTPIWFGRHPLLCAGCLLTLLAATSGGLSGWRFARKEGLDEGAWEVRLHNNLKIFDAAGRAPILLNFSIGRRPL